MFDASTWKWPPATAIVTDVPPLGELVAKRDTSLELVRKNVQSHVWTGLNGDSGAGKTQLACQLAHSWNFAKIWLRFRGLDTRNCARLIDQLIGFDGSQSLANAFEKFLTGLDRDALVVLDDIPRILPGGGRGITYARIVVPFISRFWEQRLQSQRFAFSNPKLLEQEITAAKHLVVSKQAQRILAAIASSLGVSVGGDVEKWLRS